MTAPPLVDREAKLFADFDAGHKAALARAVSIVENHRAGFDRLLKPAKSAWPSRPGL